jgi:hypothetical protein
MKATFFAATALLAATSFAAPVADAEADPLISIGFGKNGFKVRVSPALKRANPPSINGHE